MSQTIKYHELCHPYREEIKKERRQRNKHYRKAAKQFFERFCEILPKPRDLWLDYCGEPNEEVMKERKRVWFMED
jgi:hypothetical protein